MKGKKTDALTKDTLVYTIGNYLVKAIVVISAPIFTRLLTTDDYGRVTLYTTWLSFFGILTCLELKGTIINAFVKFEVYQYKAYVKNCITISFIAMFVCELLLFLFASWTKYLFEMPYSVCAIGVLHAFFNGMIMFLSHYLSMNKHSIIYIVVAGIQAILNVALSVAIIIGIPIDRFVGRILGQFLASAFVGIGIIVFFCANQHKCLSKEYTKFAIPLSIPLIFHALSGIILAGADKIMLSSISTASEVGIYGFAGAVLALLNTITVSFYTSWRPFYFDHLKHNRIQDLKDRTDSYLRCYTVICIGFMLVMPELVMLLAEKSYWKCIPILIPLAVGEFFYFLYTLPMNFELYHSKNIWAPIGSVGGAIINILINLVVLKYWGAMGAAISTLISNVALWLLHDFVSRNIIGGFYYPLKKCLIPSAFVLGGAVIGIVLLKNPFLRWGAAICLGFCFMKQVYTTRRLF